MLQRVLQFCVTVAHSRITDSACTCGELCSKGDFHIRNLSTARHLKLHKVRFGILIIANAQSQIRPTRELMCAFILVANFDRKFKGVCFTHLEGIGVA